MLTQVETYIKKQHLPLAPAKIVVALSGGADSVALLLMMKALGYEVVAAHCNFHLRGEESNRDEHFVRDLCRQQEVDLQVIHFTTTHYAKEKGISIEMAARELRYRWFEQIRTEQQAVAVAVAHHADDNAETLLLNLVRGSGIHGLKGMLAQNGKIIRPLLCLHRQDLELYLKSKSQAFVTDSTNVDTLYKRNKIRHEVLPLLATLNPAIAESLAKTAQRIAEAESLYNYACQALRSTVCEPLNDGIRISIETLTQTPAPATLLHEFLQPYGFPPSEIGTIAEKLNFPTGTLFEAQNYLAVLHRGHLEVRKRPHFLPPTAVPCPGTLGLNDDCELQIEVIPREQLHTIPKQADKVALDADSIHGELFIRSLNEGDRFQPFGMKGTKLVNDYLTDRHRSLIDKKKAWVVCDKTGIVWLVNERVAQRNAIKSDTQRICVLTLSRRNMTPVNGDVAPNPHVL